MTIEKGSQENLIRDTESMTSIGAMSMVESPSEIILTKQEREYLLHVQRGDIASVRRILERYKDKPHELDKDCLDPVGRSSIVVAIENENIDLLEFLLHVEVKPKDSLLHAIKEEYVEGVEVLLQWEEKNHKAGQPYSWECMSRDTAAFTEDITPLILAAHHNHYEILKILLDRGASLPIPHDIKCGCDNCVSSTQDDSLRHSLSRINSYRALSSPSLIALSSKDPILTSFELAAELNRLQHLEHEFKSDYLELSLQVQKFATELLDQTRTRKELAIMLNYSSEGEPWVEGEHYTLDRLEVAIKHNQKGFVAHPNVQQLLGAIWYDGLPGFRKQSIGAKTFQIFKFACSFPILSMAYIANPDSEKAKIIKKPFIKFLTHCSSYLFFLSLLALASQRIEFVIVEFVGTPWMKEILEEWKIKERGSLPGIVEMVIIFYIFGLIWAEVKQLWANGLVDYVSDLWNIVDYITNVFFMSWIILRATSWVVVRRELWLYDNWPWYPREDWDNVDPMLIADGCFGAAMIFSYLKLVNVFSVNPHLGPLQISLGRMIFDILKFFVLYTLVLFAFGCGLNQLMWYYAELEMKKCYHLPGGLPDYQDEEESCFRWRRFTNLFETSQSLYWASFGLIEINIFDLIGIGSFTRYWGLLMFGSYSVINVIVLLNLLIAMMSNSYQLISECSDREWKFARTKLWMSYFDDGATVPPPFNLIPSIKTIKRKCTPTLPKDEEEDVCHKSRKDVDLNHQDVMRLLVRRYITEQQRKADEKGVTEDDINEVKQEISTFRYELIEILKTNGMNTSFATGSDDNTVLGKKGKAMERRLKKGFNIGLVEGLVNEVLGDSKRPKNIFTKIARVIGKKEKTNWNARVSRVSHRTRDQIGSSETSLRRSQQSLRRRVESDQLLHTMNPESIVQYNPQLESHSPATRIAYAKFKVNTLKKDKETKRRQEQIKRNKEKADQANQSMQNDQTQLEEDKVKYRAPTPSGELRPKKISKPNCAIVQIHPESNHNPAFIINEHQNKRANDKPDVGEQFKTSSTTVNPTINTGPNPPKTSEFRNRSPGPKKNTNTPSKSQVTGQMRTGWL